jgi:double-stranded uracil-DNA glycosylase
MRQRGAPASRLAPSVETAESATEPAGGSAIARPPRPTLARPTLARPTIARPTKADLLAAYGRAIPDVLAPGLTVVFCGINPGLWSAATAHHFARPGNRFWQALHRGGFTPRQLDPAEQELMLTYGLGITNLVERGTARADELTASELAAGAELLAHKIRRLRPAWLAVLGVTAFRSAYGRRDAAVGAQPDRIGDTGVWILPNPSGLNAHYTLDRLSAEFAALRKAALG